MNPPPLRLYHDISPSRSRLVSPDETSRHFLIIGGGVIGLTTAWALLDAGHHVTIIAKEWASWTKAQRLTSQIAGALWEYPPAVCGQHLDRISLHHSKRWAMTSYHIWNQLADPMLGENKSGVAMRRSGFFFPRAIDELPVELAKMKEISISGVRGFCRNPSLAEEHCVNPRHGIVDAYEILAPSIDTDVAMGWLMQLVATKGAMFVTEEIQEDLLLIEDSLRARFGADAIVNCTGLGSATVANDASCYPLRGAMIRLMNDGKDFPKVESALAVSADVASDNEMVFIVPRNDSILYLGGIVEPGQRDLNLTMDHPTIKRMRARCEAFLPDLKKGRLDEEYPLAQGLRPFRATNVRVERELRQTPAGRISRVVHSYGHGGAGWSLAFGCAGDVRLLLEEVMRGHLPAPMREHGNEVMARL